MSAIKLSIIIPLYKNKELFFSNLEKNWQFIKKYEVIIVDDASNENIRNDIEKKYPTITYLSNTTNQGFGITVNKGVKESHGKYILLLNTDVFLMNTQFEHALSFLETRADYFGVSFMQKEKNNTLVGKNILFYRKGFLFHRKAEDTLLGLNAWAECGSTILRKKHFEQLHGFSSLLKPFYFEDIDLSYRAYKRGWKVMFDPSICVTHFHESTTGKYFTRDFVQKIAYKNHFIFMWKNLTDKNLWTRHIVSLPYYFVKHLILRDWNFFKGFFSAIQYIGAIQKDRKLEKMESNVNDNEVLSLFS